MAQPQQQRNGRQLTQTKPLKIKEEKKGRDPETYRPLNQMPKPGKMKKNFNNKKKNKTNKTNKKKPEFVRFP